MIVAKPSIELTTGVLPLLITDWGTYVAFTSSFAGTGGIIDAEVDAEAMVGVVACSGALFEGDFLRERKPSFGDVGGKAYVSVFCRQVLS